MSNEDQDNRLASAKRFRQLAAKNLREHREENRAGLSYAKWLSYGLYLARKDAADRVQWDETQRQIREGKEAVNART